MKHTILLAGSGLMMGGLSAFVGLPMIVEIILWIIVFGLWFLYGLRVPMEAPVRRFAFGSTMAGLMAGSMQVFFMEKYQANNSWYQQVFETSSAQDLATRLLIQGIAVGLVAGIVVGLLVRWRLNAREA